MLSVEYFLSSTKFSFPSNSNIYSALVSSLLSLLDCCCCSSCFLLSSLSLTLLCIAAPANGFFSEISASLFESGFSLYSVL